MATSDSRVSVDCVENGAVQELIGLTHGSSTEIIIVRHGETEWNALGKMQGQLDVDLNDVGRQQAVAVAEQLSKEENISGIYSSDLKRALDTAEIIASKCGGIEVTKDQALRERHLGELQGLVYHELSKADSKTYEIFNSSDQQIPGGGESRDQVYQRSSSSLRNIAEKHKGGRVIVVTHGAVIRTFYRRIVPNGHPGKIWNTSVSVIQLFEGDVSWSIKSWNDISHLDHFKLNAV